MKRVLIVDDMAVFREPIAAMVRELGFEPACAGDGQEALDLLGDQDADLILLDLAMPTCDGLEFLAARGRDERLRRIPVLLLTASTDRQELTSAVHLGIQGCLLKSAFTKGEFERKLAAALTPSRAQPRGREGAAGRPARRPAPPPAASVGVGHQTGATRRDDGPASANDPTPPPTVAWEEARASIEPVMEATDLEAAFAAEQDALASMSPGLLIAMKMCMDPNATIENVVKCIRVDHKLSLKLIKVANSAGFSRGAPVTTLNDAVLRIGMKKLATTIRNLGMIETFFNRDCGPRLSMGPFWEHALAVAVGMAEIGALLDWAEPDNLFTVGLLHDLGRLVLHDRLPEVAERVLDEAARYGVPCELVERALLGEDHAEILMPLLPGWGYDLPMTEAIRYQHAGTDVTVPERHHLPEVVAILRVADAIAHALMLGTSGNARLRPFMVQLHELGIADDDIDGLLERIDEKTVDLKLVLLAQDASIPWPQQAQVLRQSVPRVPHPLIVGEADCDRLRVWVQRLNAFDQALEHEVLIVDGSTRPTQVIEMAQQVIAKAPPGALSHLPIVLLLPPGSDLAWPDRQQPSAIVRAPPEPGHLVRLMADLHRQA